VKLAMVLHPSRESAAHAAASLVEEATRRGIHVLVDPDDLPRLPGAAAWEGTDPGAVDLIVAVGGDGTMLEAARLGRLLGVPIIGVDAGTVGFLTEVEAAAIPDMLDRVVGGEYQISERMTLRAVFDDGTQVDALNDVVTEKALRQHVVSIAVTVDGERFVRYRTDAVIVATSTGSTAYTHSAGGPLVDPAVDVVVLSAVAPHSPFRTSVVFAADVSLRIDVVGDRAAKVHADGRMVATLAPGDGMMVRRGPLRDRIARLDSGGFIHTVRAKLVPPDP
jgi:NAD+ kinase